MQSVNEDSILQEDLAGEVAAGDDSGCESTTAAASVHSTHSTSIPQISPELMFRSFSSCSPRYSRIYDEFSQSNEVSSTFQISIYSPIFFAHA